MWDKYFIYGVTKWAQPTGRSDLSRLSKREGRFDCLCLPPRSFVTKSDQHPLCHVTHTPKCQISASFLLRYTIQKSLFSCCVIYSKPSQSRGGCMNWIWTCNTDSAIWISNENVGILCWGVGFQVFILSHTNKCVQYKNDFLIVSKISYWFWITRN